MLVASVASLLALILVPCVLCQDEPETVKTLDVAKYLGRWYQTYASPFVMETFEKDAVCVTADYGLYNSSVLTVYNANRILTGNGELNDIRGFAYTTSEPGKLAVDLSGGWYPNAPYWIIKLGPTTFGASGLYEYAIVTDPARLTLFVLVRDVAIFRNKFEKDVLAWLENNGFQSDTINEPIKTYHEKDCQYAPKPRGL